MKPEEDELASARRADRLGGLIMSPFCPGKTLDTCTSPKAAMWRADIRSWTAEGISSEEIRQRLDRRAGRSLRSVPPTEQAVWMPFLTLLLATVTLALLALRTRRQRMLVSEPVLELDAEEDAHWNEQLDEELAALD